MAGNYDRKDYHYRKAKEEGYRSRAADKLIEINDRFKVLRPGMRVIDLGAWPGGWLQVASRRVGRGGSVVGIDLKAFEDFEESNIKVIQGDVRDEPVLDQAIEIVGGQFDLLLSDMAPNLSGVKEVDRYASVGCAELALWVAQRQLRPFGNVVLKLFKSNEAEMFVKSSRPMFNKVVRFEPKSSRRTSSEYYFLGLGFQKSVTER